jgi:EAL domain-containing protein (putative c-di-GMP-specific phosphodiesterase class I)
MTEPGRAQFLLEQLAGLGVRISIDDFGAGYTSLGQLKDLPVTELKIDRSFVTSMTAERSDALIVRSVVELGHNLGLTIVAEGVETLEALHELREFGCDVAQGDHLSKPMPVDRFDDWYLTRPIVTFEADPVGGGTMIVPVDIARTGPPRPRYG